MEMLKVEINDFGGAPCCEHNYPCPIYPGNKKAVYNLSEGFFQPSWTAQREGWKIVHAESWFQKLLLKWFFGRKI